jgi:hypothetical protein
MMINKEALKSAKRQAKELLVMLQGFDKETPSENVLEQRQHALDLQIKAISNSVYNLRRHNWSI